MALQLKISKACLLFTASTAVLAAAPHLVLTPQTAYTVSVAPGQNGSTINLDATNKGEGSLNLMLSSSVPWLVPSLAGTHSCGFGQCIGIQIALNTASLATGTYTGFVTVSDPNAIDAPQTISVTVGVGGFIPNQITLYAPPGGTASQSFSTGGTPMFQVSTQSGGNWLSVAVNGVGSFSFNVPYTVTANAASLSVGSYQGQIAFTGSSFAPDNKNVPVTLNVTSQPILQASPAATGFTIAQGAAAQTTYVSIANAGQGTLGVSNVTASTTSGGNWLTAQTIQNGSLLQITANSSGLSPGVYQGSVTVASNSANSSVQVPVTLTVVAPSAPVAAPGGAVNNATFAGGESLAQGDIVALFGTQFTTGGPAGATSLPLSTNLSGTQVFVNNQPVPVYYVSATQIDFQIPYDAQTGDGVVSVNTNGQQGNQIYINLVPRAPRIYVVTNAQGQVVGTPAAPVQRGSTVVIYGIGFGQTTPTVPSGTASPSSPQLATVPGTSQLCAGSITLFSGSQSCASAFFTGLTPNYVGLYQVNVTIPQSAPTGDGVPVTLFLGDGTSSNSLQVSIR